MTDGGTPPARGSDQDYCSAYPAEGHHMVSESVPDAELVRWIERCSPCGWVDGRALDEWAKTAIKESMTRRAQRIAVTAQSEPFSFSQASGEELTLEEILFQALGAASMCWEDIEKAGEFNSIRAIIISRALQAEIERALDIAMNRRERAVREELNDGTGNCSA